MKATLLLFGFSFYFSTGFAAADATPKIVNLSDAGNQGTIGFLAIVKPGSLRINGTGGKGTGIIEIADKSVSGEITVKLADMKTGIGLRDSHLKDKYLEVNEHPNAILKITEMLLPQDPFASTGTMKAVPFKGVLTVHGVENQVSGTADVESTDSSISVNAKTKTSIAAHNIEKPSYLGVKVTDDIEINANLRLKK